MTTSLAKPTQGVLFCTCAVSRAMPAERVEAVAGHFRRQAIPALVAEDFCGLAARVRSGDPVVDLTRFLQSVSRLVVVACEPRAAAALFDWAGLPVPEDIVWLNLRRADVVERLAAVLAEGADLPFCAPPAPVPQAPADWPPWFPVVDRQRCVNCGKCLDFCLFGVYAEEAGRIVVRHPQNCKNNCPACARVCPTQAVVFAKFASPPINGGEVSGVPGETVSPPDEASTLAARKAQRRRLFRPAFEKGLND